MSSSYNEAKSKLNINTISNTDFSELNKLALISSSKGNQRKWYNTKKKTYIKEQFYYQGKYWDDWKVEVLSGILAKTVDTNITIVKQNPVILPCNTFAVESDDFCLSGYKFVSINRILQKNSLNMDDKAFPMDRFDFIVKIVDRACNLDISEYLIVMCVLDYILLNEDRHLNNFGVLEYEGAYKIAPLFDFGFGLFEHEKKYYNKSYDSAYNITTGKPFNEDMLAILYGLLRSKYSNLLKKIIKAINWKDLDLWIPNELAAQHIKAAQIKLEALINDKIG